MRKPKFKPGDEVYVVRKDVIRVGKVYTIRIQQRREFQKRRWSTKTRFKYSVLFDEKFKDGRKRSGHREIAWVAESSLKAYTEQALAERVLGDSFFA